MGDETIPRHPVMMPTLGGGPASDPSCPCLVAIRTGDPTVLGKRFPLVDSPTRIGRDADNHIVLGCDSVSRRHASLDKNKKCWLVSDDGSTNGTFHNNKQVKGQVELSSGDRVKIGPTIFTYLSSFDVERRYHEEIYLMTILDGLTGAHDGPYFFKALDREISSCRRDQRDLTIVLFDLDQFQRLNEVEGHLAGDFVLAELAHLVSPHRAPGEVLARLHDSSFALLLPDRSLAYAEALAQALRRQVSEHRFLFQSAELPVTLCTSAALLQESDLDSMGFVKRAAEQLDPVGTSPTSMK